uniref:Uncharacterized protein n=1 Tax=Peronospora matthiolae TaxID=2874970 RepID=A0AAV1V3M3_9STRA
MKMISLHVKPDAVHRRDKAALPLQSPQIVSYIQEVTLRKYQNQEEAISAGSADELEPTLSVTEMVLEVCTDEGAECMEEGAERIEEGAKLMNEGPADDAMTTASDEGKILRRPDRTTDEEDENVVRNWKKTLEQAHTRLP